MDLALLVGKLPGLFEKMKRHPVGVEIAVGYLGYSYSSSTGKLALAAMRAFGLFENDQLGGGHGKADHPALDIATDYPRESQEWWDAVKKAALAPNIHAQLWQRYGASLPPDDELAAISCGNSNSTTTLSVILSNNTRLQSSLHNLLTGI